MPVIWTVLIAIAFLVVSFVAADKVIALVEKQDIENAWVTE